MTVLHIPLLCLVIATGFFNYQGNKPYPARKDSGKASYYGREFEGRKTANGEIFRNADFTAAHRKYPFNTLVKVTNNRTRLSVTVRINDRGPYVKSRIIDLSECAARSIGSYKHGLASVTIEPQTLLRLTPEIDSLFRCEDILDCLGNPDRLSGYSLSLWRSKDILHMLYFSNEIYLKEDVEKVYIVGFGTGEQRIYHLVMSGYYSREKLKEGKEYYERKGFMDVKILR